MEGAPGGPGPTPEGAGKIVWAAGQTLGQLRRRRALTLHTLGDLSDRRSAASRERLDCVPRLFRVEQRRDPGIALGVFRPALVSALGLCLG